jgi:hypothetical protein
VTFEIVWSVIFLAMAFVMVEFSARFGSPHWRWLRFPLSALFATTGLVIWWSQNWALLGFVVTILLFISSALFTGSLRATKH